MFVTTLGAAAAKSCSRFVSDEVAANVLHRTHLVGVDLQHREWFQYPEGASSPAHTGHPQELSLSAFWTEFRLTAFVTRFLELQREMTGGRAAGRTGDPRSGDRAAHIVTAELRTTAYGDEFQQSSAEPAAAVHSQAEAQGGAPFCSSSSSTDALACCDTSCQAPRAQQPDSKLVLQQG